METGIETILVFKTTIEDRSQLQTVQNALAAPTEITEWSVDLEDCDNVLRVVGRGINPEIIIK